jgi:hypothetical protein
MPACMLSKLWPSCCRCLACLQPYPSTSYKDDLAHAFAWLCVADGDEGECNQALSW